MNAPPNCCPGTSAVYASWPASSGKTPEASAITAGDVGSRREAAVGVARDTTRAVQAGRAVVAEVQAVAAVVADGAGASRGPR